MKPMIDHFAAQIWAMERGHLEERLRRVAALEIPPEAVQAAVAAAGERQDRAPYATRGGVAVIDVVGDIWKDVPWVYDYFGVEATSTRRVADALAAAMADETVDAVLFRVDSPGGVIEGVQELGVAIRAARETGAKPVAAYIEDWGASAAYWIASQASHLTANETAGVGSIGVYSVLWDSSKLFADAGIKVHLVASGPHKGVGVDGVAIKDSQLDPIRERISELAGIFVAEVALGRRRPVAQFEKLATGRMWTAPRAYLEGLIDGVEGFDAAIIAARAAKAGVVPAGTSKAHGAEEEGMDPKVLQEAIKAAQPSDIADLRPEAVTAWREEGKAEGHGAGLAEGKAKGREAGLAEGEAKGRAAERERVLKIRAKAGEFKLDAAGDKLIESGESLEAAEGKLKDEKIKALTAEAPPTPGADAEPKGSAKGDEDLTPEQRAEAAWGKDADLRKEFGDNKDAYLAFAKAEANGQARVLRRVE